MSAVDNCMFRYSQCKQNRFVFNRFFFMINQLDLANFAYLFIHLVNAFAILFSWTISESIFNDDMKHNGHRIYGIKRWTQNEILLLFKCTAIYLLSVCMCSICFLFFQHFFFKWAIIFSSRISVSHRFFLLTQKWNVTK